MGYLGKLEVTLKEVLSIAEHENKLSGFCIGNTSKVDSSGLYFSPIRNTQQLVAGSVIVYKAHHAAEIARAVDGKVQYIFVDAEKKVGPEPKYFGVGDRGNIERAVRDTIKESKVLTYKGNDLTVDSIECCLAQLVEDPVHGIGGKKVAILGAGNLGSKLALRFVERGAYVFITRRDEGKLFSIVKALNYIKPEQTFGEVVGVTDNELAAKGADFLIGMTDGTPVITSSMIDNLTRESVVMDAGKGCIFPDALQRARERNLPILRVDVRVAFEGQVAMLLRTEQLTAALGRRSVDGISFVSAGLLALENEVVVDNVNQPSVIYGLADGRGDFVRKLSYDQDRRISTLQALIDENDS